MKYHFSKFKFTNGIFYKSIQSASIEQFADRFEINVFPYFNYCGTYYIESIGKDALGRIVYITSSQTGEYYISISSDKKKVRIFKSDKTGIILKS